MCLAIPMRIESLDGDTATVSAGGSKLSANVMFIDTPIIGDYVLIHAGFAISRIDEQEAEETIRILNSFASD